MSQIKQQIKQPQGRRYSLEDKIFSLTILKQCPKAYRFLERVFALPSKRLLTKMLNKQRFNWTQRPYYARAEKNCG